MVPFSFFNFNRLLAKYKVLAVLALRRLVPTYSDVELGPELVEKKDTDVMVRRDELTSTGLRLVRQIVWPLTNCLHYHFQDNIDRFLDYWSNPADGSFSHINFVVKCKGLRNEPCCK